MARARRLVACLALLLLGGCAELMPNTAAAIAPATIEDLQLGLLADIEEWLALVALLFGV